MKVLVIGATGQTGRHAVRQLLARGDEVTAFARNPSAVDERRGHLRVAQGDARDPESIDLAAFMVAQLTEDTWLRKCVVISY